VGVHNPDGAAINDAALLVSFSVQVSGSSPYTVVGSAPVVNGSATVGYTLPGAAAGHSVTIQAASSGAAYLPGSSSTEIVNVPKPPPPPPPCVVPTIHHRETLAQMRSALRRGNCGLGPVRRSRSRRVARGYVIGLGPRSGSRLPAASLVQIVLSRRRR
jgi:hypothetical protein